MCIFAFDSICKKISMFSAVTDGRIYSVSLLAGIEETHIVTVFAVQEILAGKIIRKQANFKSRIIYG